MAANRKASEIAAILDLKSHSEGGFYSETFRDQTITISKSQLPHQYKVDRPVSTSIYFLLSSGSVSSLHRIPSAETWHFYMGEPLTVFELHDDGSLHFTILSPDLEAGHRLQYTVPPYVWFGCFPTLDVLSYSNDGCALSKAPSRDPELHYSLVGCTCAPAFQFEDFELATQADDFTTLAPKAGPLLEYLVQPK